MTSTCSIDIPTTQPQRPLRRSALSVLRVLLLPGLLSLPTIPVFAQPDPQDAIRYDQSSFSLDPDANDQLGYAMATGDYNCDFYQDLVVGLPSDDISGSSAGAVLVAWGNASGLGSWDHVVFHQGLASIPGDPSDGDGFGMAFATGNFDGASCDDLAIGIPQKAIAWDGILRNYAGAVVVLRGTPEGFEVFENQYWRQGYDGLAGAAESGDYFGEALVAGNFNGDAYDDLAVGVRGQNSTVSSSGAVHVLYGTATGLQAIGGWQDRIFTQDHLSGSSNEEGDQLGRALAAGDFDDDGYDDLAMGVPYEDWSSTVNTGVLFVLYGSDLGLTDFDNQIWHEGSTGVPGASHPFENFGQALATGDYDGDGVDDLAVAIPGDSLLDEAGQPLPGFGKVLLFFGEEGGGLGTEGIESIRGYQLVDGSTQPEQFGRSLVAANFDLDPTDDLLISAPYAEVEGSDLAGRVYVVEGRTDRTVAYQEMLHQGLGMPGLAQADDYFGWGLAAGDFDGNGAPDAVLGAPWDGPFDYGSFTVVPSPAVAIYFFQDGFESGDTSAWSP